MEKMHINERGSHTTVIEGSRDILKVLGKIGGAGVMGQLVVDSL